MELAKEIFQNLNGWGLTAILFTIGILEFTMGLYKKWKLNDKLVDLASILFGKLLMPVVVSYFALQLLPKFIPEFKDVFSWVPFWWGFFIICIADDLTQYCYHRLHH